MIFFKKEGHAKPERAANTNVLYHEQIWQLKGKERLVHLESSDWEKNGRVRFGDYITWNLEDNGTFILNSMKRLKDFVPARGIISIVLCLLSQSCLTLCNPMGCSLPGSSVHGILQPRILEGAAMPSSNIFRTQDQTQASCSAGRLFTIWAIREAQEYWCG